MEEHKSHASTPRLEVGLLWHKRFGWNAEHTRKFLTYAGMLANASFRHFEKLGTRSMSSIKRDVKKKAPPRPEGEIFSRDPAHCSLATVEKFGWLSILVEFLC